MNRWAVAAAAASCAVLLATGCASSAKLPAVPTSQLRPATGDPGPCLVASPLPDHELGAVTAQYIEYREVDEDIREPVTKFGGQPVWLEEPQWPVSAWDGSPQQFVGQVALDDLPGGEGKIAYLFVTADPEVEGDMMVFDDYPEQWDPFHGDNAVVIQPGGQTLFPTTSQRTGPTVESSDERGHADRVYAADLTSREDPAWISSDLLGLLDEDEWADYAEPTWRDKVGGTPIFVQAAEYPGCGRYSTLALQLTMSPFSLNLGDGGTGYLFLDREAVSGVWLTQTH